MTFSTRLKNMRLLAKQTLVQPRLAARVSCIKWWLWVALRLTSTGMILSLWRTTRSLKRKNKSGSDWSAKHKLPRILQAENVLQPGAYEGMDGVDVLPPAPATKAKNPTPTTAQHAVELKECDLWVLVHSLQHWGDICLHYTVIVCTMFEITFLCTTHHHLNSAKKQNSKTRTNLLFLRHVMISLRPARKLCKYTVRHGPELSMRVPLAPSPRLYWFLSVTWAASRPQPLFHSSMNSAFSSIICPTWESTGLVLTDQLHKTYPQLDMQVGSRWQCHATCWCMVTWFQQLGKNPRWSWAKPGWQILPGRGQENQQATPARDGLPHSQCHPSCVAEWLPTPFTLKYNIKDVFLTKNLWPQGPKKFHFQVQHL